MDLFFAEDEFVYSSFMTYFHKRFGDHACGPNWSLGCGLIINGKRDPISGSWYATVNGQQKVMDTSFYNFVRNTNSGYDDPGFCMVVKRQNGMFGGTPFNCAKVYAPTCEYNNTYNNQQCPTENQGKRYFNIAACGRIETIRDGCGNVVKGLCELSNKPAETYEKAVEGCRSAGMDLFTAETKEIYDSLVEYSKQRFENHVCGNVWSHGCGIWIGGRQINEVWMAAKDRKKVVMNTEHYRFITSQDPGQCMALKNSNGFAQMAFNCEQKYGEKKFQFLRGKLLKFLWFLGYFCEFDSMV